jgi:hypothetical protein
LKGEGENVGNVGGEGGRRERREHRKGNRRSKVRMKGIKGPYIGQEKK